MMRITRIDVAAETSGSAAIVRDADRIGSWFYRPGEERLAPQPAHIQWAAADDDHALWQLAQRVQRGLEHSNGGPGRAEAYLAVIGALLD
jgi:hypothetical protein